jgi:hypothetical protein
MRLQRASTEFLDTWATLLVMSVSVMIPDRVPSAFTTSDAAPVV